MRQRYRVLFALRERQHTTAITTGSGLDASSTSDGTGEINIESQNEVEDNRLETGFVV